MLRPVVDRIKEEPIGARVVDLRRSGTGHAHDVRTGGRYLKPTGRVGEEARVGTAAGRHGEYRTRDRGYVKLDRSRGLHEGIVFSAG